MTIIFTDDDDINDSPCEPDVVISPLRTLFTGGFAPAVHYIKIENTCWSVPYQDGPLASTAHCDCLVDNDGHPTKSHSW